MKVGTFERDEVLALSLLSALAGESIFLLGLPGVGKSMVARRLKLAFYGATVFEYLMSRFSTPDEIFGPVSISKLKDEDSYERVTAGYLPEAEIVFLDEIWKAGPAIQNSLLTVLNEKIFLNGNKELYLPIKGIISASNELPTEGEGLEALWDRFLLRYVVEPLNSRQSFVNLISSAEVVTPTVINPITDEEYESILKGSRGVSLSDDIIDVICAVRERLTRKASESKDKEKDEGGIDPAKFYISDRRWKKSIGVIRVSAYLNGRNTVDLSDLLLLRHMLWNDEDTIKVVEYILVEEIVKLLFRGTLEEFKSYKRHATKESTDKRLLIADREYYVVLCDEGPLKLKISDYKMMRQSAQIYFGVERTDGTIAVRQRGQFSIQVVKEGFVCINNYNYPLRTNADRQLSETFLIEFGEKLDALSNSIRNDMNDNLFLMNSSIHHMVAQYIGIYRKRISEC